MFRLISALVLCSWFGSSDRQEPVPQDRADLPNRVESWYEILQGSQKIGAMRERLERVRSLPWRYEYTFRSVMEFESWDPKNPRRSVLRNEEVVAEALLDDSLAPVYAETIAWADEERSRWTLAAGTLRAELAGTELRTSAADGQAYGSLLLALYAMRQGGQFSKEGRFQIRLLDPRGAEASFDAGPLASRDRRDGPKSATRVAFLKPPPAAHPETEWKEAWIDKYGRLLEASLRNGIKIVLVEDGWTGALPDRLWRNGRRCPFDRAEALRRSLRPDEIPVEHRRPEVNRDTFRSVWADADKILQAMAEARASGRSDELRDKYFEFLAYWKALWDKAAAPQRLLLDERREAAERYWPGAAHVRAEAARLHGSAVDRLERGECASLEEDIARLRRLRDRIELERRPELLDVLASIARAEPLLRKCRDREELNGKLLDLEATAEYEEVVRHEVKFPLAMSEEIRFVKPRFMAVLNGELVRPGDVLPREGVKVEQITRHAVLVSLREELRWIRMREGRK